MDDDVGHGLVDRWLQPGDPIGMQAGAGGPGGDLLAQESELRRVRRCGGMAKIRDVRFARRAGNAFVAGIAGWVGMADQDERRASVWPGKTARILSRPVRAMARYGMPSDGATTRT
ncbi:hypothetical protein GCM10017567_19860 [Amycolatopsis bullii]|uniref:Uncharacterized protein n=1 Tax=Amycolatopsis bullii TaxID=941987 RepID=A0ABQ3K4Y7_9PSEU|nr:hypothetical protein GCM10017567_19860 [Amycolatopsis bullii]